MEGTKKKNLIGVIVSDKMQDTAVVAVDSFFKHKTYKKFSKKTKRYKAHNPENKYVMGDKVEITSTNPISKTKRFLITKKI